MEVKLKFPQKEQVTTINPCILCSDIFRKPFFDLLSSFCVRSLLLNSAGVWGAVSSQWVQGRVLVGSRGEAPGSSENTVPQGV